jgi:cytochrome c-type biogenesis protein CcmH
MRPRKSSCLALLAATATLAQSPSLNPSAGVLRVGRHLACQCGCSDTVATCEMLECSFSKPAKERIARLQAGGTSDQAILDQFISDYGKNVYRGDPSAYGWLVPYASILAGLGVIWLFVRKYRKPRPLTELSPLPENPALEKYTEQIEKDLSQLD